MAQQVFDPTAWVHTHRFAINNVLRILGLKAEESRVTLGGNLAKKATQTTLAELPARAQMQLPNLLTSMGLFNGKRAPEAGTPDHILVVTSGLRRLRDVLPSLMGQDFICLSSSRDWNEQEDGPRVEIASAAERRAKSKWCQWANSPEALRRRDTLEPSFFTPHDAFYGLTALAVVDASRGQSDLSYVVPHQLYDSAHDFPSRILLEGSLGSVTIYPRMGVGRGAEWGDLKRWVSVAREQSIHMGAGKRLDIVTHATSVLRMRLYAHEILAQEWPDCSINIVAPTVQPDNRYDWIRDALQELAFLIGRSE